MVINEIEKNPIISNPKNIPFNHFFSILFNKNISKNKRHPKDSRKVNINACIAAIIINMYPHL